MDHRPWRPRVRRAIALLLTVTSLHLTALDLGAQDVATDADRDWRFVQKLVEDGMADLAMRQYEQFATAHPRDPRAPVALLRAAEGLGALGQVDRANALYERVLRDHPSSDAAPPAALARADALAAAQRFDDAAEAYGSLLSAYPAAEEVEAARLGLAEALMARGDETEARRLLGRLIGGRATDEVGARALFDLALLDRRAGADSLAIERFDAIHDRYPGRPIAAFGLLRAASMLEEAEAPGAARERYEKLLADYGEAAVRARAHLGLAALVEEGDPQRAMGHFRAVAEEGGGADDVQTALIGLARAALAAGEHDEVREAAAAFTEKYPTSPRRGRVRLLALRADLAERTDGAVDALLALGDATTGEVSFEAAALAAGALEDAGSFDRALDAWRRAERSAPGGAERARALLAESALSIRLDRPSLAADLALTAHDAADEPATRARALARAMDAFVTAERWDDVRDVARRLLAEHPISRWAIEARARLDGLEALETIDSAAANEALADLALDPVEDPVAHAIAVATVLRDQAGRPDRAVGALRAVRGDVDEAATAARLEVEIARAETALARMHGREGRDDDARAAMQRARAALASASGREDGGSAARRAAVLRIGHELATAARPDAPWTFDSAEMPIRGAVGRDEGLDPTSDAFDAARNALAIDLMTIDDTDTRAWIAWRRSEIGNAPLEERIDLLQRASGAVRDATIRAGVRVTLGQLLLEQDDATAAARELSRVLEADAPIALAMAARYAMAEAQRAQKRYAQAGRLYADVATAHPESAKGQRSLLLSGDCALYAGRSEEAVERYRTLLERYPTSVYRDDAQYRLGTALQRDGRLEAAREPLLALVDAGSGYRGRALARLASVERARGHDDQATAALARLVEVDAERALSEGAHIDLAELALDRDDPQAALRWLDDRDERIEPDAAALALRVRASARAGRTRDAGDALERLSLGFPDSGDVIAAARMDLADARVEANAFDAALESYSLAATETASPDLRARAAYGMALVHAHEQRWADARQGFESAADRAPSSRWAAEALYKLGQYHGRTDDPRASQEAFAQLVERFPRHPFAVDALRGEARAWRQMNRFDEALERYHRILEDYPDAEGSEDVLSNIAYCHHEMGQYEIAIAAYERVMPYLDEEGQAYAQFWVADSLMRLGRFEASATEFLKIPYLYPGQGQLPVTAQLKAGEAYEGVPDLDAARQLYDRVLRTHGPNSQWGAEAKRRLDRLAEGERGSR